MSDGEEPIDYLRMAQVVVRSRFHLPEHMVEDAAAEAVFAGWRASHRHDPDLADAMSLRGWVWMSMHHGVQDWLRAIFGRHGDKRFVNAALSYDRAAISDDLDGPRLLDLIPDPRGERDFEVVEARETLAQLVAGAMLTERETFLIVGTLQERTLLDLAADLGVSEGRACQIRLGAFKKMRDLAGVS